MKAFSLALLTAAALVVPALAAEDTLYLDTVLKDGYQIKGQSSVVFTRDVDHVATQFSRVEVIVQRGKEFALCAIETNLDKNTANERPCVTFE